MLGLQDIPPLLRTLPYLKLSQLAHRVRTNLLFNAYALYPRSASLGLGCSSPTPQVRDLSRFERWLSVKHASGLSARQRGEVESLKQGRLTLLNHAAAFAPGAFDWRASERSLLWRYHLHYHDYALLLALARRLQKDQEAGELAAAIAGDWAASAPLASRPGWEPYPVSLRIVNWIGLLSLLETPGRPELVRCLFLQVRFLLRHLEYHILGNHLLKNAKALLFASYFFSGPETDGWRSLGKSILRRELEEQVLEDGGHFERSPMYHAAVLEDLLDIWNSFGDDLFASADERTWFLAKASSMRRWLESVLQPDGRIPLLNDSVLEAPFPPEAVLRYAERTLGPEKEHPRGDAPSVRALEESGYFVLRSGRGWMIVDCGDIGPDYLPAHAHSDTLSFEWSYGRDRVIVDSGVSEYAPGSLRDYARSVRAHNTVRVDGMDQSEMWMSHRVGRRARPLSARHGIENGVIRFHGAHDGYRNRGVIHGRHVAAIGDAWLVADALSGRGTHRVESFIHLAPGIAARLESGAARLDLPGGQVLYIAVMGEAVLRVQEGWYCPDWGVASPNVVLALEAASARMPFVFGYCLTPEEPVRGLRWNEEDGRLSVVGRWRGEELRVRL